MKKEEWPQWFSNKTNHGTFNEVLITLIRFPGLLPVGWDGIFHAVTRCVGGLVCLCGQ